MLSASVMRARIFSYLYHGLKGFHMHGIVDVLIPLLLHASLLFFFGGLVAFLIPVNKIMWGIVAAILCFVVAVYLLLTLLPLLSFDCPYHTPLSRPGWAMMRAFKKFWHHRRAMNANGTNSDVDPESYGSSFNPDPSTDGTMVKAIVRVATKASSERDRKALIWIVNSLSADSELEPFVAAIPDVLWEPRDRRHAYNDHIRYLVHHRETQLHNRIVSLLDGCQTGLLTPEESERRQVICYKAVWAIASLPEIW
jgi:hypothetical protein